MNQSRKTTRALTVLATSLFLCLSPSAQAQSVIDGGLKALDDWLSGQIVKPNTLDAAILKIKQQPKNYLIRVQEMGKGERLCEIQAITVDASTGWMSVDFNYRGGTRLNITREAPDSFTMRGAYKINLPLLGSSDVQVRLMFSPDGSAMGRWSNMGFDGAFDLLKVR